MKNAQKVVALRHHLPADRVPEVGVVLLVHLLSVRAGSVHDLLVVRHGGRTLSIIRRDVGGKENRVQGGSKKV